MAVDFAETFDMAVVNTFFRKQDTHLITYTSGGHNIQDALKQVKIDLTGCVSKSGVILSNRCEMRQRTSSAKQNLGDATSTSNHGSGTLMSNELSRKIAGVQSVVPPEG
uniref:Reverse transcriptase domain-containing protein n=1 Tax=Ascaris lumbricoides TaxID=6252 RepID=A0A0M3HX78_ASCLU